jgi:hypothetical protein
LSVLKAGAVAGISQDAVYRFERGENSSGHAVAAEMGFEPGEQRDDLGKEAKRALDDFAYFRLRYMGRRSLPWAEEAAYHVRAALEEPHRSFVVMNAPPGVGKSTLFTHDVVAWLICRRRGIRILIGSRTSRQAKLYVARLRHTLERDTPILADSESKRVSHAQDAAATLMEEFGVFRPFGREARWADEGFTVLQPDGVAGDDKERTVAAYGKDEGFLGGRYDLALWDDLVDRKNTRSKQAFDDLVHWWQTEGETRIEPGGALILQGQRMAPRDLYRWALDVRTVDDKPKYRHITFPAHNDKDCADEHEKAKPYPNGCLLDPNRLPWRDLQNIARQDSSLYDVQYQQKDGVPADALLAQKLWLDGGVDEDGERLPGCYDSHRLLGEVPEDATWSVVGVDPSPSNYWGIQWWAVDPTRPTMWLVDVIRRRMSNLQFLSYDLDSKEFSGVLNDLYLRSRESLPITHVVVETNAAQKWLLSQQYVQRWQRSTGAMIFPHVTHVNKLDPRFGVQGLAPLVKQGALRFPTGDAKARWATHLLTDELLHWPHHSTDDQVMASWFVSRLVQTHKPVDRERRPQFGRPSWMGEPERGLRRYPTFA